MSHQRVQNWQGGNRRGPNRPTHNTGRGSNRPAHNPGRGPNQPRHNPGSVHSRLGVPRAGSGPNPGARRWQNAGRGPGREDGFLQDARDRLEEGRRGLEFEQPAGFQQALIQDSIFVVENQVYGRDAAESLPVLQVEIAAQSDVDYRRDNGSLQVTVEPGHHDVDYRRVQVKTSEAGSYEREPSPPRHGYDGSYDDPRQERYRMYPTDYPDVATRERSAERDFPDPYDNRGVRRETPERTDPAPFDIRGDRPGDVRDRVRSRSRNHDDRQQFSQDRRSREDDHGRDGNRRSRDTDQGQDNYRYSRQGERGQDRTRRSREDTREQDSTRRSRSRVGDGGSDTNSGPGDVEPVSDWETQLRERAREFGRQQKEEGRRQGGRSSRERPDPWQDSSREGHDSHRASRERQQRSRSLDRVQADAYGRVPEDAYGRDPVDVYGSVQTDTYDRDQYRREGLEDPSGAVYHPEEAAGSYRDDRPYSAPRASAYGNSAFPAEPPPDSRDAQYNRSDRGEEQTHQQTSQDDVFRNLPRDQSPHFALDEYGQALPYVEYLSPPADPGFHGDRIHGDRHARSSSRTPSPVVLHEHPEDLYRLSRGKGRSSDSLYSAVSSKHSPDLDSRGEYRPGEYRGEYRPGDNRGEYRPGDNRGEYRPADSRSGDPYDMDYGLMDRPGYQDDFPEMRGEERGRSMEYQPPGEPGGGEQDYWNSREDRMKGRGEQHSWNSQQERREGRGEQHSWNSRQGRDSRGRSDAGRRDRYAEEKQEVRERDRDSRNRSRREEERSTSRDRGKRGSQSRREQCAPSRGGDRAGREYEQESDLQRSLADEINKIRQEPDQMDRHRGNDRRGSSRGTSRGRERSGQHSHRKNSDKSTGGSRSRTSEQRPPKSADKDSRSAKRKRSPSPRRTSGSRQEDSRGSRSLRDKPHSKEGDARKRSPRDGARARDDDRRKRQSPRVESRGRKEDTREKRTRGSSLSNQTEPRHQQFVEEESGQLWPLQQPPSTAAQQQGQVTAAQQQGQVATEWALETQELQAGLPPWRPISTQGSYQDFGREGGSLYHSTQQSAGGAGLQSELHGEGRDMPQGQRGRTIVEIQPAVEPSSAHATGVRTDQWQQENAGGKTSESQLSQSEPSPPSQKGPTQANLVEIPSIQQAQERKKQKSKSSLEVPSAPRRFPPSMSFPEKLLVLVESYGVRCRQEVETRIHKYEKEVKDGFLNSRMEENNDDKSVEHLGEHLPRGGLWKLKLLRRIIVECLPKKTAEAKNKILWLCRQLLSPEGIEVTEDVFTALTAKRVTKYGSQTPRPFATGANLQPLEPKQVKNEEKRDMVVEYLQRLGVPATREAVNGMLQNNQMLENIEKTFWIPHQDRRLVERYLQQISVPITPEAVDKIMGNPDILADLRKTFEAQESKEEETLSQHGNDDHQSSSMATSSMATSSMAASSMETSSMTTSSHRLSESLSMTPKDTAISKSDSSDAGSYKHLLSTAQQQQNLSSAPLAMAGSTAASVMYSQPSLHVSQASARGLAGADHQQRAQNINPYGGPAQMHREQQRQQDSSLGGYSEQQRTEEQQRDQQRQLQGQQQRQLDSSRGGYSEAQQRAELQQSGMYGGYSRGGSLPQHAAAESRGRNPGLPAQQQMYASTAQPYTATGPPMYTSSAPPMHPNSERQQHLTGQQTAGPGGTGSAAMAHYQTAGPGTAGPAAMGPGTGQLHYQSAGAGTLGPAGVGRFQYQTAGAGPGGPGAGQSHYQPAAAGPPAGGESLESTRVFIMDLFRQVNLAWVPESTVQEILRNPELVRQIQQFRSVGMPLELLVNYLKQCLQLVNRS
ncbi:serine/arginine repetitive matrix protein 2-like [Branchiostoma lanceolatum]|uniref:serine/arginine repetitive matrix protein 2-like n=1 Tax=Branchiostoma lanceolatum TaxID=7740 RepID=UPI0034548022